MVFGSVGPVFIIYLKKNAILNYFFKLSLNGLGSFSVKNIYQNTFSTTTHCTPPLHICITYRVFGPSVCVSVCLCVCVCVCVYQSLFFSQSIQAAHLGQDNINKASPVCVLITTDQDGQKILCSEGLANDSGRERTI